MYKKLWYTEAQMADKIQSYCRYVEETLGAHPWKPFLRGSNVAYSLFQTQFFTLPKP